MPRLGARSLALLAALLLATLGVWLDAKPAAACDCAAPLPPEQALRRADVVFRGTLLSSADVGRGGDARTDLRFRVDAVYKGTAYREQVVATPRDDRRGCGLAPQDEGSTWVVFTLDGIEGTGDDAVSRLITTACSGNLASGTAPSVLGRPRAPLEGRSDRDEASTNTDRALSRALRVVGLTGLGLGLVAGVGLALIWRAGRPPSTST